MHFQRASNVNRCDVPDTSPTASARHWNQSRTSSALVVACRWTGFHGMPSSSRYIHRVSFVWYDSRRLICELNGSIFIQTISGWFRGRTIANISLIECILYIKKYRSKMKTRICTSTYVYTLCECNCNVQQLLDALIYCFVVCISRRGWGIQQHNWVFDKK